MELLLDIGNTHTHVGLMANKQIIDRIELPTKAWENGSMLFLLRGFFQQRPVDQIGFCSVVPDASKQAKLILKKEWDTPFELTYKTIWEIGIDYTSPESVGNDRLANTIALAHYYGSPAVAIDFGTAVTFDIVNCQGNYAGGIIAPGLSTMTSYLHEKTAQLPCIELREVNSVIGKSTADAMRIGAIHGYRGLIKELLTLIKQEIGSENFPIVATGGYAELISNKIPDILKVDPDLTLKGIYLAMCHSK